MLTVEEYAAHDGTGLAELVRCGEVKPSEVHEAALRAVELADARLNASAEGPWPTPLDGAADGPFTGVPFALKDIGCHPAGVPQHLGSRALANGLVCEHDTELMARFRRAGLAAVCTTKTPELALNAATEPRLGGPVRNPWDDSRGPGGSSGGSAALVAAGALPLAHANDGAGSIRIPAGYTGTVGLKPSRGRVPLGPDVAEGFYGNVVELGITRTVRDTAALLDAVHGPMPGERHHAPPPARRYLDELDGPRRPLRIAVCPDPWSGQAVHPEVARTLDETAALLDDLGHHVEVARPPLDWEEFLAALTVTFCAGTAAGVFGLAGALGIQPGPEHFEATTLTCAEAGRVITPMDLDRAFAVNNTVSRALGGFMAGWDVLVTPVALTPPVAIGTFDADDPAFTAEGWVRNVIAPHPTCALYNVSGAPAISLPLGWTGDGLPIGVQFGAEVFREALLLGLAAQLEQARPWSDRRPPLHVTRL